MNLNKSAFVIALDCPRKLWYNNNAYPNLNNDNAFLKALAVEGQKFGAIARIYYGCDGATFIKDKNIEKALQESEKFLSQENVSIAECAFRFSNLEARADILQKTGNNVKLIEVKSRVFNGVATEESVEIDIPTKADDIRKLFLSDRNNSIKSGWIQFIADASFQKYVFQKAFPQFNVKSVLALADKTKKAISDGLNLRFKQDILGNYIAENISKEESNLLKEVDIDGIVNDVLAGKIYLKEQCTFLEILKNVFSDVLNETKPESHFSAKCGACEYRIKEGKSGFAECASEKNPIWANVKTEPTIFDIRGNIQKQKEAWINEGKMYISELEDCPFDSSKNPETAIKKNRQIALFKGLAELFVETKSLKDEMSEWVYPLHMIDFETATPAIPYFKGMSPYEIVAFQFSAHTIYEDGSIAHTGNFLCAEPNKFPNFDFIRALKSELDKDNGTIFRYATHENTVLKSIQRELEASSEFDKDKLIAFIESITECDVIDENGKKFRVKGERNMVDLRKVVGEYYQDSYAEGSESLKFILPAILKRSEALSKKYSNAIYGGDAQIKSKNFDTPFVWYKKDLNDNVIDPYKLLADLDLDETDPVVKQLIGSKVNKGDKAIIAYNALQNENLKPENRSIIFKNLLKYCELDTFAMVLLYEGLKDLIDK